MIGLGTIINTLAIVAGGILGLTLSKQLSPDRQTVLKFLMGVLVVYVGLSTSWRAINGSFLQILKQLGIVVAALMIGRIIGRILRIQKGLNQLGRHARAQFESAQIGKPSRIGEGFVTCTLLFCVGPMAILGAIEDGLTGNFRVLAVKGLMDGLATMAFIPTFGWGAMLAAVPVFAYQGTITLLANGIAPYLEQKALLDSVNATGGLLIFCLALLIFEIKRVEIADYLPSLAVAPLLTWLTA